MQQEWNALVINCMCSRLTQPYQSPLVMIVNIVISAPEVIGYDPLSLATDMWSIGVITYIL